jgi:hypothetical protein
MRVPAVVRLARLNTRFIAGPDPSGIRGAKLHQFIDMKKSSIALVVVILAGVIIGCGAGATDNPGASGTGTSGSASKLPMDTTKGQ